MSKHIMLVDDDPVVRLLLSECLTMVGHTVTAFEHGSDALDAIGKSSPDLLFVDMLMPDMSGIEVTKRARLLSNSLPIVVLSANADRATQAQAKEAQANTVMEKPWKPAELFALIDSLTKG